MRLSELEERYRQQMSMPLSQLPQYDEGERFGILYNEESIRIFLIRSINQENIIKIEIEFDVCPHLESNNDAIPVLEKMISNLYYLKGLLQHGYQLEIIENSCIWSLRKGFTKALGHSDLVLLLPSQ